MIIDRNLKQFVISAESSVQASASKISSWQGQIAFCVDPQGKLLGSVSNGDLIRWIAAGSPGGTDATIADIANRDVKTGNFDNVIRIERLLQDVLYVPIVDVDRHIVAVARRRKAKEGILIGNHRIDGDYPTFVIAEIGNNHQGDLESAFELIEACKRAGADCAKFQMRDMQALYGEREKSKSEDLGAEYIMDLLERFQLSDENLYRCFEYTEKLGMIPLCTAWERSSADRCATYGLQALKVASADLTNHDFIEYLSTLNLPLICSTGMSEEKEIIETVNLLKNKGAGYVMLHCNSTYPAPFRDVNLNYLPRLSQISGAVVGYSGHERDVYIASAAVALGARVIEKHITLDRSLEGNDHKVSLLPDEFQSMVRGIRQTEEALGSDAVRDLSQGERANRVALSKSLFANRDIDVGTVIEPSMIDVRSPGQGLQPNKLKDLLGVVIRRKVESNTPFYLSDILETPAQIRSESFSFDRPWGIPVRHRDALSMIDNFSPDFVEFHLSYRDLLLDDEQIIGRKNDCGLVVHAPELFENDHTLDLTSLDLSYRMRSIKEMQRVVQKTISLSRFFNAEAPVGIVCNVGGFTDDHFLSRDERVVREDLLLDSWKEIQDSRVSIWPQTMPPYPWHFGGQRFHNLFVTAEDILSLCERLNTKVCLDVSHSRLACNELGKSFDRFLSLVVPVTAYLHLADAKGSAGEGLQIGDGEIDFEEIFRVLAEMKSTASFIPEIWQGHENNGEGARIAITRLNRQARMAREKIRQG